MRIIGENEIEKQELVYTFIFLFRFYPAYFFLFLFVFQVFFLLIFLFCLCLFRFTIRSPTESAEALVFDVFGSESSSPCDTEAWLKLRFMT